MITHIVFFKLIDRSTQNSSKAAQVLRSLEGKVPVLKYLDVGIDLLRTNRSYDIALVARFESLEDLEAYQNHPEHIRVAEYMAKVRDSAFSVDYES